MKAIDIKTHNPNFPIMSGYLFHAAGLRLVVGTLFQNANFWYVCEFSTGLSFGSSRHISDKTRKQTIQNIKEFLASQGSLAICDVILAAIEEHGILNQ